MPSHWEKDSKIKKKNNFKKASRKVKKNIEII